MQHLYAVMVTLPGVRTHPELTGKYADHSLLLSKQTSTYYVTGVINELHNNNIIQNSPKDVFADHVGEHLVEARIRNWNSDAQVPKVCSHVDNLLSICCTCIYYKYATIYMHTPAQLVNSKFIYKIMCDLIDGCRSEGHATMLWSHL